MTARHLRYNCMAAGIYGNEQRHPQVVMRELGITYQVGTPKSVADQWWFWNCENVPQTLPPFLKDLGLTPHEVIGYGLTQEGADKIAAYKPGAPTDTEASK